MNYGLQLSLKLEKFLAQLEAEGADDTQDGNSECLEDRAMKLAQDEMSAETGGRWKPWCANGKSIRMGEIVLIIDADTIIPEDCFRDAAREMYESPDVAIIQHESGKFPFRVCRLSFVSFHFGPAALGCPPVVALWRSRSHPRAKPFCCPLLQGLIPDAANHFACRCHASRTPLL